MQQIKTSAIILAAGSGKRMYESGMESILEADCEKQGRIKKQYMQIGEYPVVYYSLKAFADAGIDQLILVTGADEIEYCRKEIVEKYQIPRVSAIVAGGAERYHSVFNGLQAAKGEYVLIHDGARPCVTADIISRCLNDAKQYGTAVAAMPVKDTIKRANEQGFVTDTPVRSELYQIQTPQVFSRTLICQAYEGLFADKEAGGITDDAMLVERYTEMPIRLSRGDYRNIKVTTPEDLLLARMFLGIEEGR